jgi:hypothetical protein
VQRRQRSHSDLPAITTAFRAAGVVRALVQGRGLFHRLPRRLLLGSLSQNVRRGIATVATWHRNYCDAVSQELRRGGWERAGAKKCFPENSLFKRETGGSRERMPPAGTFGTAVASLKNVAAGNHRPLQENQR